jgi:transposase
MNIHKNARLTPICRERLVMAVLSGQTPEAAARAAGVCPRTARKWVKRFEAQGPQGLQDRSSRPARLRQPSSEETVQRVMALRRRRFTGKQIALETGVSPATVSRILKRGGLNRLKDLEPEEPARRYERSRPGEMLHLDIKKLGRFVIPGHRATGTRQNCRNQGAGWDFAHVAIDDHSRIAFSQIRPNEKATSAIAFLEAAVAYYRSLGVVIERVSHVSSPFSRSAMILSVTCW